MYNLDLLKEIGKNIKHCGDYGILMWNESEKIIHWCAGDADFGDNGKQCGYTNWEDITKMFEKIPFVDSVEIDCEYSPFWGENNLPEDGWTEIKY